VGEIKGDAMVEIPLPENFHVNVEKMLRRVLDPLKFRFFPPRAMDTGSCTGYCGFTEECYGELFPGAPIPDYLKKFDVDSYSEVE